MYKTAIFLKTENYTRPEDNHKRYESCWLGGCVFNNSIVAEFYFLMLLG